MTKIQSLKNNELFNRLSDNELGIISKFVEEKVYPQNTPLFFENMKGEAMYIVVEGAVKICKMLSEGEERTLTLLGPGDYFGEMALMDEGPRSVSAIVHSPSKLLVIKRASFQSLLTEAPQVAVKVILGMYQVLSSRIRSASPKLQQLILQKS